MIPFFIYSSYRELINNVILIFLFCRKINYLVQVIKILRSFKEEISAGCHEDCQMHLMCLRVVTVRWMVHKNGCFYFLLNIAWEATWSSAKKIKKSEPLGFYVDLV